MKLTKIFSLLLVAAFALTLLASCAGNSVTDAEALTYVSLRINPEIELLADADGTVVAAGAVNEDGEVVLSVLSLEGERVEEAGALFVETATELGYLTPGGETDTVYVDVDSTAPDAEALEERLNKSIHDYFTGNGINGKISPETLDKYAEKAADWGVSVGHTKLVMRALDAHPELTDEEVLAMSTKEVLRLIKGEGKEEKITAGLTAQYRADVLALKAEYAELFALRKEIQALKARYAETEDAAEKESLSTDIAAKEAIEKVLADEYKTKLSAIKDTYKAASKEARKAYRAEAEKRRKGK